MPRLVLYGRIKCGWSFPTIRYSNGMVAYTIPPFRLHIWVPFYNWRKGKEFSWATTFIWSPTLGYKEGFG